MKSVGVTSWDMGGRCPMVSAAVLAVLLLVRPTSKPKVTVSIMFTLNHLWSAMCN